MVAARAVLGLVRGPGHGGRHRFLRHAEGYLKAIDSETGEELYKLKTRSGIISNVMTCEREGKQHIGILSGVGGWAGIGLAAGLTNPTEGLGAVGGHAVLSDYTALGGHLTVFELPD